MRSFEAALQVFSRVRASVSYDGFACGIWDLERKKTSVTLRVTPFRRLAADAVRELTVEAESTAWAMQLRLLAAKLLKQIAGEVGPNVVKKLHIHGPAAPTWVKGPRRVAGRGPRDTYG